LVGISQSPNHSNGILPFQLDKPGYISHALAALVIYCLYNTVICWSHLRSQIELPRIQISDFFVVLLISIGSLLVFISDIIPWDSVLIRLFGEPRDDRHGAWALLIPLALGAVGFVVSIVGYKLSNRLTRLIENSSKIFKTKIHILLERSDWILIFNPQSANARKEIEFRRDGTIGKGQNDNEDAWAVVDGHLEIYKKDGSLQNRFILLRGGSEWKSTDEPQADAVRRGIPGQRIILKPSETEKT
jgi:hypothetical protein